MSSPNYVLIKSTLALDPSATSKLTASSANADLLASQAAVRRPLRGIQVKREVFATLSVQGDRSLTLRNSSAAPNTPTYFTSNFFLQSVQETRSEKFQTVTTFGAPYGFFFGEQPRMVSFGAILLNTADFQWEAEWWENYDQTLRGTRLVDRGVRAALAYEDVVIEGYIVQASTAKSEPNPWAVNLNFTMWVTGVLSLIDVGAPKVDPFHEADSTARANEFIDLDADSTAQGPTMMEEVRARNIAKLTEGDVGLLGALRGVVDDVSNFVGKVGAAVDSVVDWLYGRNMVIPAGFAGSERIAGSAMFAEGAGAVIFSIKGDQISVSAGVTVRAPVRVASVVEKKGNFFEDNVDEYPTRWASGLRISNTSETFRKTGDDDPSIVFAEEMFKGFGIDVLNDTGQHTSAVMQALGRSTFAALSYAASGASAQDAAALAGTATSADYVSASAEQAALEALT